MWYAINAGLFLTAAYLSPEDVMRTHPRRVMYAFGFQFILMAFRLQLSGVTHDIFNPFRRTSLITWAVLIAHILSVTINGAGFMSEPLMYLLLAIISSTSLAHFVYNVADELTTILGINLLTMTEKQLAAQPQLEAEELAQSKAK